MISSILLSEKPEEENDKQFVQGYLAVADLQISLSLLNLRKGEEDKIGFLI